MARGHMFGYEVAAVQCHACAATDREARKRRDAGFEDSFDGIRFVTTLKGV